MSRAIERTYRYPAPQPPDPALRSLSGLEILERLRDGTLPRPSLGATLGFAMHEVEHGRVVFVAQPSDFVLNPMGTVHGGFHCSMLDSAVGCAVHSTLEPGEAYTTLQLDVTFVRPMVPGGEAVAAIGEIVHRGRRTASARGELRGRGTDKLYAHGTTTCLIMPGGDRRV